jgi:homoaconitate hydratase family protein/3-isopropylmalate dehydratase small subunit
MGLTLIEKIISQHAEQPVSPGQIVDVGIDVRVARDFGGASVVRNLQEHGLAVADPARTFFTFDCNPGGSDQGYAANQHLCRQYARQHGIGLRDINAGIGTHVAIEEGWVGPGATFVSTDSHANIMGAVGAFGQGMGDQDIAAAWAQGKVWFKVPPSLRLVLKGRLGGGATAKDIVLAMARQLGANGLLGHAAEIEGPAAEALDLAGRITVASMATEMGGIIILFAPDQRILSFCARAGGRAFPAIAPDPDAAYAATIEIDIDSLQPLISRPGHPEDVVPVQDVAGRRIDSVFIGSCTNGRLEDLQAAARILKGRRVAEGVVLKIVPATRGVWAEALTQGLLAELTAAGALIGNPGCAGCAAGQIGQNGPGEVTVSTGNRNYAGKQGKGEVYLASPATAAASAVAGCITTAADLTEPTRIAATARPSATAAGSAGDGGRLPQTAPQDKMRPDRPAASDAGEPRAGRPAAPSRRLVKLSGRVWVIGRDNIDTDMIYHNKHLAVTDPAQMGRYTFGNLPGWEDFPLQVQPGDIVVVGENFGCGSSRQQAVDCFKSLGVAAIVARSYGAIYERNAINAGLPVVIADLTESGLQSGDRITVDLPSGLISWDGGSVAGQPLSGVQMSIYQRGGLLAG